MLKQIFSEWEVDDFSAITYLHGGREKIRGMLYVA